MPLCLVDPRVLFYLLQQPNQYTNKYCKLSIRLFRLYQPDNFLISARPPFIVPGKHNPCAQTLILVLKIKH